MRGREGEPSGASSPLIMAVPDLVNLSALIDGAKCFALVRQHRRPKGVRCPVCSGGLLGVRAMFSCAMPTSSLRRHALALG